METEEIRARLQNIENKIDAIGNIIYNLTQEQTKPTRLVETERETSQSIDEMKKDKTASENNQKSKKAIKTKEVEQI